jgi:hypothetical protein
MPTAEGTWTTTRSLRNSLYGDLVWRRPHVMRRDMVLEAGSEQLAMLRWEKAFSLQATAISADGRWTIGRKGMIALRRQVEVSDAASGASLATFDRHWRGSGVVRFATGAEYRWQRAGFWRPRWSWSSAEKEQLLVFRSHALVSRVDMETDPAVQTLAELPVLVVLGAYLMAVMVRRGHAH